MSTIGVVAVSLFCGLFLALLLAGLGTLIWLAVSLRKTLATVRAEMDSVSKETRGLLAQYQGEMAKQVESSKSSFGTIRTEMGRLLEENRKKTDGILNEHRRQMQGSIDKINAEALQGAAARAIQACLRLEKAVGVIQQLFLTSEEKVTNQYGAEDFAPEDSTFGGPPSGYSQSQIARFDDQMERVPEVPEDSPQAELFAAVQE
jgi:hypothetical protein